jgi:two-component system sensor kinase FixL
VNAQREDGSVFPIHLFVSEVPNHPTRKFVALIRDISLQRAAEREARQHREQLAHVDRLNMLGEMATGIAHEINQPLTAISLFAQAGKRLLDAGNQGRLPDIFDKLSQHSQRAGAVIERMQAMARQRESVKETVDCNALVEEVVKLAEAEARIRDISIDVEADDELPPVVVDTVQIQQVVLNLLRNGMEAMRSVDCRNGSTIRLQTRRRHDGDIEVAVIDDGCGVSERVAEKIFAPFSTTKESGMGMGLSISRAIITAHGGRLEFHNNDTDGATFSFTLPATQQGNQHG